MKKRMSISVVILTLVSLLFTGCTGQSTNTTRSAISNLSSTSSSLSVSNLISSNSSVTTSNLIFNNQNSGSLSIFHDSALQTQNYITQKSYSIQQLRKTQSKTVYITRTGKKYHRSGCRYLRQSKIAISLKNAKAEGYTACSVCNP